MAKIKRAPAAMRQFSKEIMQYSDDIRNACRAFRKDIADASPHMDDEPSKKALQKIDDFAQNLVNSLPEAERAAEKLRLAAGPIEEYLNG